MGTYSDESPSAGVGERLANSISKIKRAVLPSSPKDAPTGSDREGKLHTAAEAADAQAGDADTSSNTGAGGQSTDSWNKY